MVSNRGQNSNSPGSLRHTLDWRQDMSQLSTTSVEQLARALVERIRSSPPPSSWSASQLLGILDLELERWACVHQNRFSRQWLSDLFGMYALSSSALPPIKGQVVVELGCGSFNPLALLMVFALLGARRGIGVDLDPIFNPQLAARGLARCATYMVTDPKALAGTLAEDREVIARHLRAFDLGKLWQGDLAGIEGSPLELRHESAANLSMGDAEADLVLSNSFLEHVADAEAVVREMARVTRSGGLGVHQIDGIDHRHHADATMHPLHFLREDAKEPMVNGCNRVRPLDFVPLFESNGFQILSLRSTRNVVVEEHVRAGFVEPYRSMPTAHLEVAVAALVVRRR